MIVSDFRSVGKIVGEGDEIVAISDPSGKCVRMARLQTSRREPFASEADWKASAKSPADLCTKSADTATALTHTGGTGGGIASPAGGDDRIASHDPLAPTVDRLARMGGSIDAHSAPCWDGTPFSLALVIDTLLGHGPLVANPHTPAHSARA